MKTVRKFLALACALALLATLAVGMPAVMAANPNEVNYDFTTAEGVTASGQSAAVSFDDTKGASKFTGAFNPSFANTDTQNNVRITTLEFEYNTTGGLSMQMRRDNGTGAILGNPLAVGAERDETGQPARPKDIEFVYNGSDVHYLQVEDHHKYRFTYVYDYVTQEITGLVWDLTDGEELLFCNTLTQPGFAPAGGYKIEPLDGFDGWIYSFRSYELSKRDYAEQDWYEGKVHFDYTKHQTWKNEGNVRWAANFGNNWEEHELADGTTIRTQRVANERESFFNQGELPLSTERIDWVMEVAIPADCSADFRGNFGSVAGDGTLSGGTLHSLGVLNNGTITLGTGEEGAASATGSYTPNERVRIELALELGLGTYSMVVKNQNGEPVATLTDAELPEGAINKIDILFGPDKNKSYIAELQLGVTEGAVPPVEPLADGSFLIADFLDSATCTAWGQGPNNTQLAQPNPEMKGAYIAGVGYEVDYATDTGGSYMEKRRSDFYGLNFDDYGYVRLNFTLTVSKPGTTEQEDRVINNYFTVVLSTGTEAGKYDTYKQNECLTYEINMAEQAVNQSVELLIPLSEFVTQFDGMSGGVQGAADGTTPLRDIQSISVLGASMAKAEVGGVGNGPNVWAITNSKWSSNQTCGLRLHKIELVNGSTLVNDALAEQMAQYTAGMISSGPISLPTSLEGGTIVWSSDHPEIIRTDGTVTQPEYNTAVTLTAAITAADGTTASVPYTIGVRGTEGVPDLMIADFSLQEDRDDWLLYSSRSDLVGQTVTTEDGGYFYYRQAAYASGGGYLANNRDRFATLDFSDYKALKLDLSIQSDHVTENYFTVVLSTAENPGEVYTTDECLVIEVDLSTLPTWQRTSVYLPFDEFITEFDGMSGGVQGTADGVTDLSEIKSISLYPGAAKVEDEVSRPWNGIGATSDQFHNYTDWAFKESSGDPDCCTMHLYSIEALVDAPTEYDIYAADGTAFEDLTEAAAVHGAVTLSAVPAETEIYAMTALYNSDGVLADFALTEGTVGEGYVETPEVNYDPAVHDKVAVYIWDTNYSPIVSELVKEQ